MHKIQQVRYYLSRLKDVDFQNMRRIAKKVAQKTRRPGLAVLLDIILCSLRYQSGYMDYYEFEFYLLNAKERATYLTSGINNSIVTRYCDKSAWESLEDKAAFNRMFSRFLKREWLDLRECGEEAFRAFAARHPVLIVKPVCGCGGRGVERIDTEKEPDLSALFHRLRRNGQVLVEEVLIQHPEMDKLYAGAVNTLRMITFLQENGEPVVLKRVLKVGNGGVTDNFSSGGMYTFCAPDGTVLAPAIDEEGHVFEKHPASGVPFSGFRVPLMQEADALVCEAARLVPKLRYVGWDVAVLPDGCALIEGNWFCGIFQMKPSLSGEKTGDLPLYRQYMDL
ncbi:sugar-transfer associated ATP-grasp domain-containing protein [Yeguia hominis]|uniref:Hexapeptide transferase n=1 Tax=Yeguia hominis TaxID=2763662 RepID=A0A926D852_9FIRM|nr:sugar-transfer associated ATP-grasp domain-containing protein [Yeguia hominis]MBC8533137.1 hexapeptide transferase [Yeguia hominis]